MMRIFNIIILAVSVVSVCSCIYERIRDSYHYFHNKTNQTIKLDHWRLRKFENNYKGVTIGPEESKENVISPMYGTDFISPFRQYRSGVFQIIFQDGKLLVYKKNKNEIFLNNNAVENVKNPLQDKYYTKLSSHKAKYEITEEDYKQAEYMTHMKYRFLGGNIPENYRHRTEIEFYYYNGTQVKDAYIRGLNFDLGETKRMNYFIRGKN